MVVNRFLAYVPGDPDDDDYMDDRGARRGGRRYSSNYDYGDDDDYGDEEDDRRGSGIFSGIGKIFGGRRGREDDGYDDDPVQDEPRRTSRNDYSRAPQASVPAPVSQPKPAPVADPGQEVRVFRPTNLEEARKVTDTLLSKQSAVLNLEGIDMNMAQRIIDFVGGSNYAIRGHFTKISNFIFLFTPKDIDISGDITETGDTGADAGSPAGM